MSAQVSSALATMKVDNMRRSQGRSSAVLLSIVSLMLGGATCFAQSTQYAVEDIASWPGSSSIGRTISAPGLVVGYSGHNHSVGQAFMQAPGHQMEALGVLSGGDDSRAFGANRQGQVVGYSNTATSVRAFLWTRTTGMRDLGALPGDNSSKAFAINDVGQVVGSSSGRGGVRACLWDQHGSVTSLNTLSGTNQSVALAVNNSGQVAGISGEGSRERAFVWTKGSGMEDIGALPGDDTSRALAINDAGQIVGTSTRVDRTRAFLWSADAGMRDLGILPGGSFSEATAINKSGEVVGVSGSALSIHAFVWTSVQGMQDLNTLILPTSGVFLAGALGVNDAGQIIAWGDLNNDLEHQLRIHFDSGKHSGQAHVFLLTPTVDDSRQFGGKELK
jgi:probable HAF family extracellular repeat protein